MDQVVLGVADRIAREGLTIGQAAALMGVTPSTLRRHLDGEYVRSDSLAKYRAWLNGEQRGSSVMLPLDIPEPTEDIVDGRVDDALPDLSHPVAPVTVVDLFSGCGGMSIGFDQLSGGGHFETVLAIDIEEPMLRVLNANRRTGDWPVGRRADLAEFASEAEVLAWYLDHLARLKGDEALLTRLDDLPGGGLSSLRSEIAAIDATWCEGLDRIRESSRYQRALSELDPVILRQTSVLEFHRSLGLPLPTDRSIRIEALWAGGEPGHDVAPVQPSALLAAGKEWDDAVEELRRKSTASGRGQLASSAKKILRFVTFLETQAASELRDAWTRWRAARLTVRDLAFAKSSDDLRRLYDEGHRVGVLLGGPPCQGFSRIGRGKIRSLREHGVHARVDEEVGDARNRLMEAYVLWVSALQPAVFLFENVRHFQAEVRTPSGTFLASEALADSINNLSGVRYCVATSLIRADEHAVPQTRERFFMAGVKEQVAAAVPVGDPASWILALPRRRPVTLNTALAGLPEPRLFRVGATVDLAERIAPNLRPEAYTGVEGEYVQWIRSAGPDGVPTEPDAHVARPPRPDDSALFALMGPGKRWMDYRADNAPTVKALANVLSTLRRAVDALEPDTDVAMHPALAWLSKIDPVELEALERAADGSLSLRLLLEQIPPQPGELGHHLLTPAYLAKREGNHGDWLARLDPAKPCKTIVSHAGKDTYMYVHPWSPRTISVREAARVQSFPDWFSFGSVGFVDAFRVIGNAVPPLLSAQLADRVARVVAYAR